MKKLALKSFVLILTFSLGVNIYLISVPKVSLALTSLEEITKDTKFYDGKTVVFETYIQVDSIDESSFYLGEPFELGQVYTLLDTDKSQINLDTLKTKLKENLTKHSYKRAKVLVKGIVVDDCNIGLVGCCFGRTMTIKLEQIKQIAPVENYNRPK